MRIAAFDIGISRAAPCGLAVYASGPDLVEMTATIAPAIKKGTDENVDERIAEIVAAARVHLDAIGAVGLIAYEAPYFSANVGTTIKLAKMCGAIVALASERKTRVVQVRPSEAKRALTGDGSAEKIDMIVAAGQRFGLDALESHEADAIGVALAAWAAHPDGIAAAMELVEGQRWT